MNFGPGILTVSSVSARRRLTPWWRLPRKYDNFYVMPGPFARFGDKLPARLDKGGCVSVMFSPDLYRERWTSIGLQDTFGRTHWVPVRQFRDAMDRCLAQHPQSDDSDKPD